MAKLKIDNLQVEVADGSTILDAANKLGVHIPTMCFLKGYSPSTSCMVCVVEIKDKATLVPACGALASDGLEVITDSQQVIDARKSAIELLLSDHVGDCVGPCEMGCPAGLDIPMMIRQIIAGDLTEAIKTVKKDIALPAVLGRICPAPCEKACRRAGFDEAVSICLLKRFVADHDLASKEPFVPKCKTDTGKKVAIVGAGPAGLSAAYYLKQAGHACMVCDENAEAGGSLRKEDCTDVLDSEIALIEKIGVEFKLGSKLDVEQLCAEFDAVFIDSLTDNVDCIKIDKKTFATDLDGVFAGGDAIAKDRLAIRCLADGKNAAAAIDQYLNGQDVTGDVKRFNSRMGKCSEQELDLFVAQASDQVRILPDHPGDGFPPMQAVAESKRCLHCDCRKPVECKLRKLAEETGAKASKYKSDRHTFEQYRADGGVIFEPGKCIDCGLCIQITAMEKESLGLTFIGRGFDVRVAVPFDGKIEQGLTKTAQKCAKACPTGAITKPNA